MTMISGLPSKDESYCTLPISPVELQWVGDVGCLICDDDDPDLQTMTIAVANTAIFC